MKFRIVFWDVLPCKIIVDRRFRGTYCLHHDSSLMMEAVRTSETSVDNYFKRQYISEDNSELHRFYYLNVICFDNSNCVKLVCLFRQVEGCEGSCTRAFKAARLQHTAE
jgi:hypothetical protein